VDFVIVGSSMRGWIVINADDMLVVPDPATAWIDIFNAEPTLSFICTIVDPITREPYDRDPRGIAEKAEAYLNRPESQTRRSLVRKQNFSFSTMFDLPIAATQLHTSLIAPKDIGTAHAKNFQTSVTRFGLRKVIFLFRQWIRCKISATKWRWSSKKPACLWINSITKSQLAANRNSTFGSRPPNA